MPVVRKWGRRGQPGIDFPKSFRKSGHMQELLMEATRADRNCNCVCRV